MPLPAMHLQPVQTAVKMANAPRFVIARPQRGRGALSAKREEVPLGCNLAGPGWITGQLRRIRKLVREIATGAKRPRNDNSEVHTILTMACTDRQHCAGPGCPLPYNGVYNRREYPEICSCQWRSLPVKGTPHP